MDPTVSKKKSRIGMYEVGRTLGEGRYAKVKLGRHIETGSQVAIKIMQKDRLRKADKLVSLRPLDPPDSALKPKPCIWKP